MIYSEDVPNELNEESAAVLSQKIDDHKSFFNDYDSVKEQAARLSKDAKLLQNISRDQLISLMTRLEGIGHKASIRAVRLKFLESIRTDEFLCLAISYSLLRLASTLWIGV